MIALIITGHRKEFIAVKCSKMKHDFGMETTTGFVFSKEDVFLEFNLKLSDKEEDWDFQTLDDGRFIIHKSSCWVFKEKKSKLGSIAAAIFENENLVRNLF